MAQRPPELKIDPQSPFQEDALSREKSAQVLASFIAQTTGPYVLTVDAPWGTGKTVFLNMLKAVLEKDGAKCLYFNAWEADYSKDALIAVVAEMRIGLKALSPTSENENLQRFLEGAKKHATRLVKQSIPVFAKMATAGLLDLSELHEETLSKLSEDFISQKINDYAEAKDSITEFRKELSKAVKEVSPERSLVFMIDELDRCKPTFSIEILEIVKHFFNVENIFFIIAMDKGQLCHTLRAVYGMGFDASGYLKRFVDIEFHLPAANEEVLDRILEKVGIGQLIQDRIRNGQAHGEHDAFLTMLRRLFRTYTLPIRDLEQICSQIAVTLAALKRKYSLPPVTSILIAMRHIDKHTYFRMVNGRDHPRAIVDDLSAIATNRQAFGEVSTYIEACCWALHGDQNARAAFLADADKQGAEPRQKGIAGLVTSFFAPTLTTDLRYLINAIEISENFQR